MYHRVIASKERYSTIPANSFDFMCYNYFIITDIITTIPLPKQKYGKDMAKFGPYMTHMWA